MRARSRAVSRELRETTADWLMLAGAALLLLSLFFTWSHQVPPAWRDLAALRTVPRSPTAWQVYSIADVLLALLAVALVAVSFVGTRKARLVALVGVGLAIAFVVHAQSVPPTNGVDLVTPPLGGHPTAGFGETAALAALAAAAAGLFLSFTAD